jgi:hypothetical protein
MVVIYSLLLYHAIGCNTKDLNRYVVLATGWTTGRVKNVLFPVIQTGSRVHQAPIQWVPETTFPRVKLSGREADR